MSDQGRRVGRTSSEESHGGRSKAGHGGVVHGRPPAALLADAPGAGERFHGGFVTYKIATLAVPRELIAAHTPRQADPWPKPWRRAPSTAVRRTW
jgi:hypothetical protein